MDHVSLYLHFVIFEWTFFALLVVLVSNTLKLKIKFGRLVTTLVD